MKHALALDHTLKALAHIIEDARLKWLGMDRVTICILEFFVGDSRRVPIWLNLKILYLSNWKMDTQILAESNFLLKG